MEHFPPQVYVADHTLDRVEDSDSVTYCEVCTQSCLRTGGTAGRGGGGGGGCMAGLTIFQESGNSTVAITCSSDINK